MAATPSLGKNYECNIAYNNWEPNTKKLQVKAYNYQEQLVTRVNRLKNIVVNCFCFIQKRYSGQQMDENWSGDIYIDDAGNIKNTIKSPGINNFSCP